MENKSGEKLLSIFEYLVLQETPLRLLDISKGLGINQSTVLRFLTTLINCGYVEQDPETLRYTPTYRICTLASHVNRDRKLVEAARPALLRVAEAFRESVSMSVESHMQAVYVDVVRGADSSLIAFQQIGGVSPMYCTGNGKLLLLNYTEEELDTYIREKGLKRYTEHTITTREGLLAELKAIRERGYAYDEEERDLGIRCAAFPVRDSSGRVVAGISVSGPKERMRDELIADKLPVLRAAAEEISGKLGYKAL